MLDRADYYLHLLFVLLFHLLYLVLHRRLALLLRLHLGFDVEHFLLVLIPHPGTLLLKHLLAQA